MLVIRTDKHIYKLWLVQLIWFQRFIQDTFFLEITDFYVDFVFGNRIKLFCQTN